MTTERVPDPAKPTPDPAAESSAHRPGGSGRDGTANEAATAGETTASTAAATADTMASAEPATTADGVTTAEAVANAEAAAAESPAAPVVKRRATAMFGAMRKLLMFLVWTAVLVAGVAIGITAFQATRPVPVGSGPVGASADAPPAVAREFISALAANDADAVRSSLAKDPHLDLAREMDKFGIQRIDNVEVLGTHVDGVRSATEILMQYESEDGISFAINLVILVDGGQIEGFR